MRDGQMSCSVPRAVGVMIMPGKASFIDLVAHCRVDKATPGALLYQDQHYINISTQQRNLLRQLLTKATRNNIGK
ncbi:hypothetical protein PMPD1_0091 [Paramixta manurensis]|uniref:Uncharacterized protein n=1 Tax=Paramixta manurensis TaxID=2740817 RepID=A0A6M8U2Y2_9GAMM|nr:hypothetical protein PMPD1_0091 [Erwiniaceae bacterium PD-1]